MQGYPRAPLPPPEKPPRGALFTTLLVGATLGAVLSMAGSFVALAALKKGVQHGDIALGDVARLKKLLLVVMGASALQLACAGGMWMWKRWGVYGYVGLAVLSCILTMKTDPGHVPYAAFVRIACVLFVAFSKWSHFED